MAQRESFGDRNDRPLSIGALKEQESKRDKEELNTKKEQIRRLEFSKQKDFALTENMTEKALALLRSVFLRWTVHPEMLRMPPDAISLDTRKVQEVLQRIAEIEDMDDIDYLYPKEFRISGDEYIRALSDEEIRVQLIARMDRWLLYIYENLQLGWVGNHGLITLTGGAVFLHQDLVSIQEHTIDIKKNLKNI